MCASAMMSIRKLYYTSISCSMFGQNRKRYAEALPKSPWLVTATMYDIITLQKIASLIECVISLQCPIARANVQVRLASNPEMVGQIKH